jgi:hypothetical protein
MKNNRKACLTAFGLSYRHAGLDPASRDYGKDWIPAFAGMTNFAD